MASEQGWDPIRTLGRAFKIRLVVQLKYCSLKISDYSLLPLEKIRGLDQSVINPLRMCELLS